MPAAPDETVLRIVIVGPCGAGKSTLADGLCEHNYDARQITQEHSFVPKMWKLISKPDILIYLDASFETCNQRKQLDWGPKDHAEQLRRLTHARQHCDIYLPTDGLTPEEILVSVLQSLEDVGS
jgi:thymidylate kinase